MNLMNTINKYRSKRWRYLHHLELIDVPARSVVAGVPAKILRERSMEEVAAKQEEQAL